MFRNPLADPYLLGSASGASLGVALGMAALGASPFALAFLARLGVTGAAARASPGVLLTLVLAQGVHNTMRLLLAGVVVGVVLGAAASLVLLMNPDIMQAMQAFMLGSTSFIGWGACALMLAVLLATAMGAWCLGRVLDGLSLGEATAHSLGLPLAPLRMVLILLLALATGTAVAQTGLIAFVGLAAPHLVRSMVRSMHRWLLVLSAGMGAVLLLAADLLARWLIAPQELPVGALTALLGGSYLLWLMHRRHALRGGEAHDGPRPASARPEGSPGRSTGPGRPEPGPARRPLDRHRRPQWRRQIHAAARPCRHGIRRWRARRGGAPGPPAAAMECARTGLLARLAGPEPARGRRHAGP